MKLSTTGALVICWHFIYLLLSNVVNVKSAQNLVAPICRFSLSNLLHVNFMAPGILRWCLHFCGLGSSVSKATGYRLDGPGIESRWGETFHTSPGGHPASCTMGTGSFPGVKSSWGVVLTPHPLLVLWSWKRRAIPLLPLWAVRPVQSLSVCTRVQFTFTLLTRTFLENLCTDRNGSNHTAMNDMKTKE
jgi:hypothetical protein